MLVVPGAAASAPPAQSAQQASSLLQRQAEQLQQSIASAAAAAGQAAAAQMLAASLSAPPSPLSPLSQLRPAAPMFNSNAAAVLPARAAGAAEGTRSTGQGMLLLSLCRGNELDQTGKTQKADKECMRKTSKQKRLCTHTLAE